MFEQASKLKLRFKHSSGLLSTEDLWDLSLNQLDTIAKAINKELRETEEPSFISNSTTQNKTLTLKLDILKHIIKFKLEQQQQQQDLKDKQAKREQIMHILAQKQQQSLENLSEEELIKQLESL